ncbi:MFS general substrate transporter [Testicularia cyperi]|uniref:MFS general substrate transporter n=1 Tax=Testicularia cyperi TaxID=1882483 RepID=A0A317XXJ2_9BASI|nr:MFS general substrate transporter [Testicularia cyperi]
MTSLPSDSSLSAWNDDRRAAGGAGLNGTYGTHLDWGGSADASGPVHEPESRNMNAVRSSLTNLGHARTPPLPRNYTTQTLGRSARSSSEQYRRPPLVDRITSSRSLYLPSVIYSGEDGAEDGTGAGPRDGWRAAAVGSTPLDRTMDQIGMGRYQWTVLILSGLGWAADNMWIQAIAIILPHIQRFFAISDSTVGLASSSIFVGMFVGSIAWGTISDTYGRRAAFNITLLVTAVFGSLSALASSFGILCILLFAVGTGVGGSMPTDSSNLVENLPVRKHSYVTALSVFFSAGAVVPSLIGLIVLSSETSPGWRYLLGSLAFVTVLFVLARVVFFRLLESPKYLVHAGRPQEARDILQKIQRFNGGETIRLRIADVVDVSSASASRRGSTHAQPEASQDRNAEQDRVSAPDDRQNGTSGNASSSKAAEQDDSDDEDDLIVHDGAQQPLLPGQSSETQQDQANVSSQPPELPAWLQWLPVKWHSASAELVSRYLDLLAPEWKRTTVLIWIIWGGMSFGFTTFNVFLPKLLETRYGSPATRTDAQPDSTRQAMIDYLLYSLSSLPGSLISAYLVDTRLGRIGTMALSTALMTLSVLAFASTYWRAFLTLVSISSSISYAAIYGYTPEVMAPKIRATACGTASAISRVAGILAPLVAGSAFSLAPALPLYLAAVALTVVALAMALLPIETRGRGTQDAAAPVH